MIEPVSFFLGAAVLVCAMTALAMYTHKWAWVYRGVMVCLMIAFLPLTFMGFQSLTGHPRPVTLTFITGTTEADLIWHEIDEGKAIRLLLRDPNASAPVYYTIPWNKRLMEELVQAAGQADEDGTGVTVDKRAMSAMAQKKAEGDGAPAEGGEITDVQDGDGTQGLEDRSPVFHPIPPRANPDKVIPDRPRVEVVERGPVHDPRRDFPMPTATDPLP